MFEETQLNIRLFADDLKFVHVFRQQNNKTPDNLVHILAAWKVNYTML